MLKQSDEQIGIREIFCLVIYSIGVKSTDSTPAVFFEVGENAGWILPIIAAFVCLIPYLFLLSVIKKYEGMNFINITKKLAGRPIGIIIGVLCFAIFFFRQRF